MKLNVFNRISIGLLMFWGSVQATDFITWTAPQMISELYQDSWLPYVATDNNNDDLCTWRQLDANSQRAVASSFDAAFAQWHPQADRLSKSVSAQGAYEQKIAMDGQGNAWAIWRQMSGLAKVIQVSRFDAQHGWWPISQSLTLSDTTKSAYYPVISMNQQGTALACWTWDTIVQARINSINTWSLAVNLSGTDAANPDCFINNAGFATVVWQRFAQEHYQIESASYVNGYWLPTVVLSDGTRNAYNPHVAMDDAGNAIAVWFESETTSTLRVYSSKRAVGSDWQSPEQLSDSSSMSAKFPQVGMNEQGNAIVLWEQYDGVNWHIASRTGSFASAWSPEIAISQLGHDAFDPHVVLNVYGSAIATWTFYDSQTIKRIQVARYDGKGKKWTNSLAQTLLSDPSHDSQSPSIACNPRSGHVVLAWQFFGCFNWSVSAVQGTQARPTIISARQELRRFPRSGYIANCMQWTAVDGAVSYEIYAADNTTLLATIPATDPLQFCDPAIVPCSVHTYYIYAIDAGGTYSDPAVVTIP